MEKYRSHDNRSCFRASDLRSLFIWFPSILDSAQSFFDYAHLLGAHNQFIFHFNKLPCPQKERVYSHAFADHHKIHSVFCQLKEVSVEGIVIFLR